MLLGTAEALAWFHISEIREMELLGGTYEVFNIPLSFHHLDKGNLKISKFGG